MKTSFKVVEFDHFKQDTEFSVTPLLDGKGINMNSTERSLE